MSESTTRESDNSNTSRAGTSKRTRGFRRPDCGRELERQWQVAIDLATD